MKSVQREQSKKHEARPSWKKPVIVETACGLEINCYVTASR